MGDRVGYRIRDGNDVSHLVRKQWRDQDIKDIVVDMAQTLVWGYEIGSGLCALRGDLDLERLTGALYYCVYAPPFDAIHPDPLTCDISDCGLYEIELVKWDHWKIWHYPIEYTDTTLSEPELIAEVHFTDEATFPDGMDYEEIL